MKNRIAIVTLPGNYNYGNRLQAYALSRVIQDMGYQPKFIVPYTEKIKVIKWTKYIITLLLAGKPRSICVRIKKERAISPFSKQYLHEGTVGNELYEYGIVGSDQVWHPSGIKVKNFYRYFLTFLPPEKRIAYAPSFGVSVIPENKKTFYERYLPEFSHISVREQTGATLVKNATQEVAQVVVDPTLLLTDIAWSDLAAEANCKFADEKYLIRYTLGGMSTEIEKKLSEYANIHGLKIREIMGDSMESGDGGEIPTVPEFLSLIKNASAVFTDSFHACVFSTIFHTPFIALKRPGVDMSSRIVTLLSMTGMENNLYDGEKSFKSIIDEMDYSKSDKNISTKRKDSMTYLYEALNISELID